jgi:hypothetical protein
VEADVRGSKAGSQECEQAKARLTGHRSDEKSEAKVEARRLGSKENGVGP